MLNATQYDVADENGELIGNITSGTFSPYFKKAIAIGYLGMDFVKEGSELFVIIRDKPTKAIVVKMPFYKRQ